MHRIPSAGARECPRPIVCAGRAAVAAPRPDGVRTRGARMAPPDMMVGLSMVGWRFCEALRDLALHGGSGHSEQGEAQLVLSNK